MSKTVRRVVDCCWWPGVQKEVEDFVGNCQVCLCTKSENRVQCKLGKRQFPDKPLELISIDFIVDLPLTERNNRNILTIIDQFMKYLVIYPIPDRTASTAAKYIYDFIMKFGIMDKLLSDQDPSYESELFQELMVLLGIDKVRTTAYNPKSNG